MRGVALEVEPAGGLIFHGAGVVERGFAQAMLVAQKALGAQEGLFVAGALEFGEFPAVVFSGVEFGFGGAQVGGPAGGFGRTVEELGGVRQIVAHVAGGTLELFFGLIEPGVLAGDIVAQRARQTAAGCQGKESYEG